MGVFSIEVKLAATLYVRASSADEARAKATAAIGELAGVESAGDGGGDIPISAARFDSPSLPDVSLSPAMTVWKQELGEPDKADG